MTPRVFVSYARRDGEALAADLAARIEANGVPVWRDRDGLRGGEGWWIQIERALGEVEFLVVVLTPGAVESPTVRKEWHLARRKGVCIFPVIASDALLWQDMPLWMAKGHCYDLKFQERKFFNDLHTRCVTTRVPFMAADLPENHIPRAQLFDALVAMMLDESRGTPKAITTALRGAGGFGKTTLARAFCHDIRTRYLFYDGILWVTLGEKPVDLTAKVDDLIYALTGERSGFSDKDAASAYLRDLLEEKHVLIVVDDVWRESDARPFLVGGAGCAWLMTTRIRETLPLDAEEIAVDEMANDEAARLLTSGIPDHDGTEVELLARRLGEWPLLLSLVNRVLVDRTRRKKQPFADAVASINEKLDRQGLQAFDLANAAERDEAVAKTLAVSFDALRWFGDDAVSQFESLAVFPEDVDVPVAVVARLWDVSQFTASEVCGQLYDLSLLLAHDLTAKTIRLHDVIRAYLRQRVGTQRERDLHQRLVASYRAACSGRWHTLPDDGYLGDHLAHHLSESGDREALDVLLGPEWRTAQFSRVGSDRAFGADADTAIAATLQPPPRLVSFVRAVYVCASIGASATRITPEALEAMAMLGRHRQAMDSASFIHDPDKRSSAYCAIGVALARRGLSAEATKAFDCAYETIRVMDWDSGRMRASSALVRSLSTAGHHVLARTVAAESVAALHAASGFWSYEERLDAASAWADCGEPAAADVARAIVGARPEIPSRIDLQIAHLFRAATILERIGESGAGARELALQYYSDSAEWHRTDIESTAVFVPAMVAALCEAGEVERAQDTVRDWQMLDWPRMRAQATICRALLFQGDREQARELASDLLEKTQASSATDPESSDVSMFYDDMSHAISDLVFVLASLNRFEEASVLAAAIVDDDLRTVAFGIVASVGAKTDWRGTGDALAGCVVAARSRDRFTPADVMMMARIIPVLDRCGLHEEVCRVVEDFRVRRPAHLKEPLDAWCIAFEEFASAVAAVGAETAVDKQNDFYEYYKLRVLIADARHRLDTNGDTTAAQEVARAFVASSGNRAVMPEARDAALLAVSLVKRGAKREATEIIDALLPFASEVAVIAAIATIGRIEDAIERASDVKGARKIEALVAISDVVLDTGDSAKATEMLLQAKVQLDELQRQPELDPYSPELVTMIVAQALQRRGQSDGAQLLARRALDAVRLGMTRWKAPVMMKAWELGGKGADERVVQQLASVAADATSLLHEDIDLALWAIGATSSTLDRGHRARLLSEVARVAVRHGMHDQAMRLVIEAFLMSRDAGRDVVVEILGESAETLANIDCGETLWRMYEEIGRTESWLRSSG